MKKLLAIVALALLAGCAGDPVKARSFLTDMGFTNVTITGADLLLSQKGDVTCTGFVGLTAAGVPVRGAVAEVSTLNGPLFVIRIMGRDNR